MEPEPTRSGLRPRPPFAFLRNRNGNLPLQRLSRLSLSPVILVAGTLIAAGALTATLPGAALAASGPFAPLAGAWAGSGTIQPGNGTTERIRCNANYRPRGSSGYEVDLNLRCASDSYNFDLTGEFAADAGDHIKGQWTERTRNIGGSAIGTARGDRLHVHVESGGFAADLSMVTRGRRQSVTIDSPGGGQPVKANITLNRR